MGPVVAVVGDEPQRIALRLVVHVPPEHEQHLQPERKRYELLRLDAAELDGQVEFTQARSAQEELRREDDRVCTVISLKARK